MRRFKGGAVRKTAVLVLAALLAASAACPSDCLAGGMGGGLSVPLAGTMPQTVSFHLLPAEPEPPGAGGGAPIAVWNLSANSFRGARLSIGPVHGTAFVLSDAAGKAYPFEIAICVRGADGRLAALVRSGEACAAVISGTSRKGEVRARFPFLDDPACRPASEALEARGRGDPGGPPLLTALLFVDLAMI